MSLFCACNPPPASSLPKLPLRRYPFLYLLHFVVLNLWLHRHLDFSALSRKTKPWSSARSVRNCGLFCAKFLKNIVKCLWMWIVWAFPFWRRLKRGWILEVDKVDLFQFRPMWPTVCVCDHVLDCSNLMGTIRCNGGSRLLHEGNVLHNNLSLLHGTRLILEPCSHLWNTPGPSAVYLALPRG